MLLQYNTGSQSPAVIFQSDLLAKGGGASTGNGSNVRLDAVDVAYFNEQLQAFDPVVYENIKGDLLALQLFPIKYVDPGAESYTYVMTDSTGKANYKTSKSNNTPIVNVTQKKYTSYLSSLDVAYEFTNQDLRAARMASSQSHLPNYNPLVGLRNQCLRACMETMDNSCFLGDSTVNLQGIVNTANVASSAAVAVAWTTATADQIYADLLNSYISILNTSLNKLKADTCIMSLALYNQIQDQRYNTYTGQSIMQVFEARNNVKFIAVPELNSAFNNGTKDGFIFFRKDPMCIEHIISIMFETTTPQEQGFTQKVFCQSRHAGLVIRQPKTIVRRFMP